MWSYYPGFGPTPSQGLPSPHAPQREWVDNDFGIWFNEAVFKFRWVKGNPLVCSSSPENLVAAVLQRAARQKVYLNVKWYKDLCRTVIHELNRRKIGAFVKNNVLFQNCVGFFRDKLAEGIVFFPRNTIVKYCSILKCSVVTSFQFSLSLDFSPITVSNRSCHLFAPQLILRQWTPFCQI